MYEFVVLRGVKCHDAACPEGTTRDDGAQDIKCGVCDSAFGGVIHDEWDG